MGWVRSDGKVNGQHTRLWARTVVLQSGGQKVALVAEDLTGSPEVWSSTRRSCSKRGFDEQNMIVSASHTHAAPAGYSNFATFNTVFMTIDTPTEFELRERCDPTLYQFIVRQIATAIRRADEDLGPGSRRLGRDQAHGRDREPLDRGAPRRPRHRRALRPGLAVRTRGGDPHDRPRGQRPARRQACIGDGDVPVGIWSTFANHGTVNGYQFTYYNEDHHGAATRAHRGGDPRSRRRPARAGGRERLRQQRRGRQSAGLACAGRPPPSTSAGPRRARS